MQSSRHEDKFKPVDNSKPDRVWGFAALSHWSLPGSRPPHRQPREHSPTRSPPTSRNKIRQPQREMVGGSIILNPQRLPERLVPQRPRNPKQELMSCRSSKPWNLPRAQSICLSFGDPGEAMYTFMVELRAALSRREAAGAGASWRPGCRLVMPGGSRRRPDVSRLSRAGAAT